MHFHVLKAMQKTIADCTKHSEATLKTWMFLLFMMMISRVIFQRLNGENSCYVKYNIQFQHLTRKEGLVEEYNAITLLRTDCRKDYSQDNSILVPRIQFLCIEVSRTLECCNIGLLERSVLFQIFKDKKFREDSVTQRLVELKNQIDGASDRGYC